MDLEQVRRALGRLLAVGQQRHARVVDAHRRLRERRAHVRELDQVLGPAAGVGADVEQQHRRGARDRHRQRQRGPVDAAVASHVEQAGGERRAGRPAGHERLRAAFGDRPGGLDDRGVRGRADRERGVGGLRDRDRRVDELDPVGSRADLGGGPEQEHLDPLSGRQRCSRGDLARSEIGPARIHGDGDHRLRVS